MRRRRSPRLMLLAAIASLLIALLWIVMPRHSDPSFARFIGLVWLVTGAIWLLAWWKTRQRAQAS